MIKMIVITVVLANLLVALVSGVPAPQYPNNGGGGYHNQDYGDGTNFQSDQVPQYSNDGQGGLQSAQPSQYPNNVQGGHPSAQPSQYPNNGQGGHPSAQPSQYSNDRQGAPQSAQPSQYPNNGQGAPQSAQPSQYPNNVQGVPQSAQPSQYPNNVQGVPQSAQPSQYPNNGQGGHPSAQPSQYPNNGQGVPQSAQDPQNQNDEGNYYSDQDLKAHLQKMFDDGERRYKEIHDYYHKDGADRQSAQAPQYSNNRAAGYNNPQYGSNVVPRSTPSNHQPEISGPPNTNSPSPQNPNGNRQQPGFMDHLTAMAKKFQELIQTGVNAIASGIQSGLGFVMQFPAAIMNMGRGIMDPMVNSAAGMVDSVTGGQGGNIVRNAAKTGTGLVEHGIKAGESIAKGDVNGVMENAMGSVSDLQVGAAQGIDQAVKVADGMVNTVSGYIPNVPGVANGINGIRNMFNPSSNGPSNGAYPQNPQNFNENMEIAMGGVSDLRKGAGQGIDQAINTADKMVKKVSGSLPNIQGVTSGIRKMFNQLPNGPSDRVNPQDLVSAGINGFSNAASRAVNTAGGAFPQQGNVLQRS